MYYNSLSNQTDPIRIYSVRQEMFNKTLSRSNMIFYSKLVSQGKVINFSHPVFFILSETEDGFYADNSDLNIHAYGKNELELKEDIIEEIYTQWGLYANELDDELTTDARKLKNNLRATVALTRSFASYA